MALTIGVDVGGTKIAAGVVDAGGALIDQVRVPTPATSEAIDAAILDVVRGLDEKHDVDGAGVAAPGFVDERRSGVRFAPNVPYRDHPLGEVLRAQLDIPVVVENDANAAAWAEFQFGAGQDIGDMVLLTVGTGLGGGIVLDGRLLRGAWGAAAELGHMKMVRDGLPCGCGQYGCWEMYASGRALTRRARELVVSEPEDGRVLLERAGGDAAAVQGEMVTVAAMEGDPLSVRILTEAGFWLGEGIADVAAILDPAVVVVGGGVAEAGDLLLDPARQAYREKLTAGRFRPQLDIRAARMGNDAGIIGAADLARRP